MEWEVYRYYSWGDPMARPKKERATIRTTIPLRTISVEMFFHVVGHGVIPVGTDVLASDLSTWQSCIICLIFADA